MTYAKPISRIFRAHNHCNNCNYYDSPNKICEKHDITILDDTSCCEKYLPDSGGYCYECLKREKHICSGHFKGCFEPKGDKMSLCTYCGHSIRCPDGRYVCELKDCADSEKCGDYKDKLPDIMEGKKYDKEKLRYDLIDFSVLDVLASRFTHGAKKYGPNNWQKVDNAEERYSAALLRHLSAWRQGEIMDQDAPEMTHLSAVLWNAFVLNWFALNRPTESDRCPKWGPATGRCTENGELCDGNAEACPLDLS